MAVTASTPASAAVTTTPGGRRRPDEPAYARPVLLLIAAVAATLCTWGIDHSVYHDFYATAVRSMAGGPRAFFFGAFDPRSAITLDKLPGFLWPQAVSAELFGFRPWALVLPQAAECVAAVLVLYVVVRRWSGAPAALFAAAVFTLTPVTVGLGRSIVEDAPFMLLLLLAAEATQRAVGAQRPHRLRPLLTAAVWAGLAFQCKMLEAWAILPTLAAVYVLGAPVPVRRRLRHLALAGCVTLAVSSSWVLAVALTPAQDRPYIDGTTDNSAVSLVVGYNFLNRLGAVGLDAGATGSVTATQSNGLAQLAKMVSPGIVSQTGWLYPLAATGLVWGIAAVWKRRVPRTGRTALSTVLWGGWLLTFFAAFSVGSVTGHTYYMGVVAVPVAALAGIGLVRCLRAFRAGGRRAAVFPAVVAVNVVWCLVPAWRYPAFLPWLAPACVGLCVLALCALALVRRRASVTARPAAAAVAAAVVSVLLSPAAWSFSALDLRYNQPGAMARVGPTNRPGGGGPRTLAPSQQRLLSYLRAHRDGATYLAAVPMWSDATPYIINAGAPLLPMGGFTGQVPFPTLAQFRAMVASGKVRYVIPHTGLPDRSGSPADRVLVWVAAHCTRVPASASLPQPLYRCGSGSG
ncbi:glycosyltransferase family 39 protein [Streptomyces sp. RB6PN25]|uniref:Glycosyltransferase family 39 protein n=1 Tax=Streptomyces humicola TaxID=2953240 RepID=A0ABT1PXH5_9ACTN|nr:glycosyltransferase family 39 protein [Streptomyces humicola]MCQ4082383.1 glycosyltransferase family 39 protein [Streptomyces humicola]